MVASWVLMPFLCCARVCFPRIVDKIRIAASAQQSRILYLESAASQVQSKRTSLLLEAKLKMDGSRAELDMFERQFGLEIETATNTVLSEINSDLLLSRSQLQGIEQCKDAAVELFGSESQAQFVTTYPPFVLVPS